MKYHMQKNEQDNRTHSGTWWLTQLIREGTEGKRARQTKTHRQDKQMVKDDIDMNRYSNIKKV